MKKPALLFGRLLSANLKWFSKLNPYGLLQAVGAGVMMLEQGLAEQMSAGTA
jgi:hypothetical protein